MKRGPRNQSTAARMASMMQDFIKHGRKEPARWWSTVWAVKEARVHRIASIHRCREAIDLWPVKKVPLVGRITTMFRVKGKQSRSLKVGTPYLRRAGLHQCEQLKYRIRDGEIVLSGV